MNYSKDYSKPQISICFQRFSKKSINNAIKVCLYLLLVLCLGLAIVTISITGRLKIETTERPSFHTTMQLESRMLGISEPKYMSADVCENINCTIICFNSKKIYDEVFQVLQAAECEEDIVLKLDNMHFPNSILTNRWKPTHKIIKSLIIDNSKFTHIRNEAFNSFDFTGTQSLSLLGVQLKGLSNGVLLGFARLKYLHLEGQVRFVDRCFFQPVQSSLVRLTLRAELTISGKDNIFGISFMSKMYALDLSQNFIVGSLSRSFFRALPKLKYLTLSNSEISSIDIDAFDDIASHLAVLDLSNNRLTTLDARTLEQVLLAGIVSIYFLGNDWICECHLSPLISLYKDYENQFGDVPYCKAPTAFYGTLLTNVELNGDCKAQNDLLGATPIHYFKTDSLATTSSSTEASVSNPGFSFKMACLSMIGQSDTHKQTPLNDDDGPVEYFLFAPPCHDFELNLLENNSVQVVVQYADEPINIIWFSEATEKFVHTANDITIDYNCDTYSDPFLLAENLEENCTYTFCLVPSGTFSITPFNCLPLHVPPRAKSEPNIWISEDEKELTLGIVCLILLCSLFFGGVVAYFGIKVYPDILKGSNHVLVVKKSKKNACYVATITEGEYVIHKNSLKKKNLESFKLNSPASLQPVLLCKDSTENKEESSQEVEDYYEMPCVYNKTHNCQQKCLSNKFVTPSSPPPLPKRNSDNTLYGSSSELISNVPYPKLSF